MSFLLPACLSQACFRDPDVTEFELEMANYSSVELSADQLEEQFRRDGVWFARCMSFAPQVCASVHCALRRRFSGVFSLWNLQLVFVDDLHLLTAGRRATNS